MSVYLLPELCEKSLDNHIFPLLPDGYESPLSFADSTYPRYVNIFGKSVPLFSGGIVSTREIEEIAKGVSLEICKRHQGKSILIIVLLEGARPFANLVEKHLQKMVHAAAIKVQYSTLQVSSYKSGSKAVKHEIVTPLVDRESVLIQDFSSYDFVLILDDLIDSGETISWLVTRYLPSVGAIETEAYFMLEKKVKRDPWARGEIDRITPVIGKTVPNEWVVGFGLDLALPDLSAEKKRGHLFRGGLPGGIYAFNAGLEQELFRAWEKDPQGVEDQLEGYLSNT